MLYPSLHLHLQSPQEGAANDYYINPVEIVTYQALSEGGSRVYERGEGGGFVSVNESPDMIATAIQHAIRNAQSLIVFGQIDAEKALAQAMQQSANGVVVAEKPGLVVPGQGQ